MKNVIQKYQGDIQQLIPKHVTPERIVLIAQAALLRNPDILDCDPRTVLAGIIQASILGLELHSALHHASLVKFWNSKTGIFEAQLMIEYPGLIELVMRGGDTSYVESQPVYAEDLLDIEYGSSPHLIHKPQVRTSRGKLIGAYAYARLKDGNVKFHYMTREDIEKRRAVSKAKDSGPWKSWEEEMYAKTPLRHLCKQLRKTTELAMALEHDNRFDQGITSVVESPDGLSIDFLSMNVEAKTIDRTESLKKQIAEKKEQPVPAAKATPKAPEPATASVPAEEKGEIKSPAMEHAKEVMRDLAEKRDAAAPAEAEGSTGPAPMEAWNDWASEAAQYPSTPPPASMRRTSPPPAAPAQAQLPAAEPVDVSPKPPAARRSAPKDPLDNPIEASEVTDVLRAIKAHNIKNEDVRKKLDSFEPKVALLRNLTVRQRNAFIEWIDQQ
jgi:recombination protein RecT